MRIHRATAKSEFQPSIDLSWAAFLMRVMVGLVFAMAGYWKVFRMTPAGHANKLFLEQFADTWIPRFMLWTFGVTIPFVELAAGALLIVGLFRRPCAILLGFLLLVVTYGHLLKEPLFDIHPYIFTRLILLLPVMLLGARDDPWSLDAWRKGLISRKRDDKAAREQPRT